MNAYFRICGSCGFSYYIYLYDKLDSPRLNLSHDRPCLVVVANYLTMHLNCLLTFYLAPYLFESTFLAAIFGLDNIQLVSNTDYFKIVKVCGLVLCSVVVLKELTFKTNYFW